MRAYRNEYLTIYLFIIKRLCRQKQITIMCLYPRLIKNKRYLPNRKNNYNPPICTDERMLYVPIGCGNCIECRRQKAREWQIRLTEELKECTKAYFVTLTFDEQNRAYNNEDAKRAIRLFLERWRKIYGKSLRHWFITELGEDYDRLHLHGIIFTNVNLSNELLQSIWKYGIVYIGNYCSGATINYITKYITKVDNKHKDFRGQIMCSAGIGNHYTKTHNAIGNKYKPLMTKEYYTLQNGKRLNLPIYLRNKIYTEDERQALWAEKLDKQEIWIMGNKYDVSTDKGREIYTKALQEYQKQNTKLGYGDGHNAWKYTDYNATLKKLNYTKNYKRLSTKVYKKIQKLHKNAILHTINLDTIKNSRIFAISNERQGTLTS